MKRDLGYAKLDVQADTVTPKVTTRGEGRTEAERLWVL